MDCVADLLNAMDIFVLPTLMEGMSNTLLEALAVGLPVMATRVGGNPEVVAEGVCGYLFAPQDVPGLVSQLRTLLRDSRLRSEFGRAARERALRNFSLEAHAAALSRSVYRFGHAPAVGSGGNDLCAELAESSNSIRPAPSTGKLCIG